MSCNDEIHVDDIGTVFIDLITDCGTPVDLSLASGLDMCFLPAAGNPTFSRVGTWASTINSGAGDGSDGLLQYTTVTSDMYIEGEWERQWRLTLPSGVFHSNVVQFEVFSNLGCF